jgi:hypothetical protein
LVPINLKVADIKGLGVMLTGQNTHEALRW